MTYVTDRIGSTGGFGGLLRRSPDMIAATKELDLAF